MKKICILLLVILALTGCQNTGVGEEALMKIKVMTFNIHHGVNRENNYDLNGIANVIRESGAEVVALQEVDSLWGKRSNNEDQVKILAETLGMNYAYGANLSNKTGYYGNLILSKYPILSYVNHPLSGTLEQRGLLLAVISVNNKEVNFASTHLGLSNEDRLNQINEVIQVVKETNGVPSMVLGDFNVEPESEDIKLMSQNLNDVQAVFGDGTQGTFAENGKTNRIDYIFATPDLVSDNVQVQQTDASDHYAVYADMILKTEVAPQEQ